MKSKKNLHSISNRQWFFNGSIIITISFLTFMYLIITRIVYYVNYTDYTKNALVSILSQDILKCTVILISITIFCYLLSLQDYHAAITSLLKMLSDDEPKESNSLYPYLKNEQLNYLLESTSKVIKTNYNYKSQLQNQNELLLENYILRLMKGRCQDIPTIYRTGKSLGVKLQAKNLQVIIFSPVKNSSSNSSFITDELIYTQVKVFIRAILLTSFDVYITEVDGMIACLITADDNEDLTSISCSTEINRTAKLIKQLLLEKFELSFRVAISGVNVGISGVEKSFSESVELFQYADMMDDTNDIFIYRDMPSIHLVDTEDYFWFKKEMQFMNCINSEDYVSAETIFNEILDSEYINKDIPLRLANCRMLGLINAMINALGKIRLTIDIDFFEKLNSWERIINCKSMSELKNCSTEIFDCINDYIDQKKRQTPYERMMEIIDYLDENYKNPNLTISLISDNFNLNASYLSRIFKKLMGISLSEYIHKVRINKAIELMHKDKLSVREISEMVGYNNVLTMNRAFKKYQGTTAGKYRSLDSEI